MRLHEIVFEYVYERGNCPENNNIIFVHANFAKSILPPTHMTRGIFNNVGNET